MVKREPLHLVAKSIREAHMSNNAEGVLTASAERHTSLDEAPVPGINRLAKFRAKGRAGVIRQVELIYKSGKWVMDYRTAGSDQRFRLRTALGAYRHFASPDTPIRLAQAANIKEVTLRLS